MSRLGFRQMSFQHSYKCVGFPKILVVNESVGICCSEVNPLCSVLKSKLIRREWESLPLFQSHTNCGGHSIQRWLNSDR